ncbi:MAG: helix-turn-helix domain-containing protein [Treponema sp.]|nr:helix-turn-helix domain-containing protein [Treponema sp.]
MSLTCRHFGIHRSYFYRWKKRYDPKRLSTLENKPTSPKRKPEYARGLVSAIQAIREADSGGVFRHLRLIRSRRRGIPKVLSTNSHLETFPPCWYDGPWKNVPRSWGFSC